MEDTSMEDFSFTQLPSASSSKYTIEQQMDPKNVVWGASIPGSDSKKPDKSIEKLQGGRLSRSTTLPSTSSDHSSVHRYHSLTQSYSSSTTKKRRQRPSARRLSKITNMDEEDDSMLLDSLPITPEIIESMFKSVSDRVEAEVAKVKARNEARGLANGSSMVESEGRTARVPRDQNKDKPVVVKPPRTTRNHDIFVNGLDSANTSVMDVEELTSTSFTNTAALRTSQPSNDPLMSLQPRRPALRSESQSSAFSHRSASPLAPSSSRAEVVGQTNTGLPNDVKNTRPHSGHVGRSVPTFVPRERELDAATATTTQTQSSSSGIHGRISQQSMIPVPSGSRPPILGMRHPAVITHTHSSSQAVSSGIQGNSSRRINTSQALSTKQKQFKSPLVKRSPTDQLERLSGPNIAKSSLTGVVPQTPSTQDRRPLSTGLPTPDSVSRTTVTTLNTQNSRTPFSRQTSTSPAYISPPQSQSVVSSTPSPSPSASVMSCASPPPPSMNVESNPSDSAKGDRGDRSSSPPRDADISFTSSDFDMGIDEDELEKACRMYD